MEANRYREMSVDSLLSLYTTGRDSHIRDLIIERHERLVRSIARKFVRPGVPLADLEQCGWIAVVRAFDRFDPSREVKFSTYAVACIVGEIKRYFRDRTWGVKVPRHLQEIFSRLNSTQVRLFQTLRREPTVAEMAEEFGVTEEVLLEAMELGSAYQPLGLDDQREQESGDNAFSRAETLGVKDACLEGLVENAPLHSAMSVLSERSLSIVKMRFFGGCSQQEVADVLGVSQMQICRLERSALTKMRKVYSDE